MEFRSEIRVSRISSSEQKPGLKVAGNRKSEGLGWRARLSRFQWGLRTDSSSYGAFQSHRTDSASVSELYVY